MKYRILIVLICCLGKIYAQDKRGNQWVCGTYVVKLVFKGDTSRPRSETIKPYPVFSNDEIFADQQGSGASDSATGRLLFFNNSLRVWDSAGNIMDNGEKLAHDSLYYRFEGGYFSPGIMQSTIALPKGSDGMYYLFNGSMSDSFYHYIANSTTWNRGGIFDELLYSVIDTKANGGLGKVIKKRIPLIQHAELGQVQINAIRHANGYDWWLIKPCKDSVAFYVFKVTADSIYGPYYQYINNSNLMQVQFSEQMCVNNEGNEISISVTNYKNVCGSPLAMIFSFDRCYGTIGQPEIINVPRYYTNPNGFPNLCTDSLNDYTCSGVGFSPNNRFLYVTKAESIWQYDRQDTNKNTKWHLIEMSNFIKDPYFSGFAGAYSGPDGRIYFGNWGGSGYTMSCVDHPDEKGIGCGYVDSAVLSTRPYWDYPNNFAVMSGPPTLPDYNLKVLEHVCWPLAIENAELKIENEIKAWPNPANDLLNIEYESETDGVIEMYNMMGQMVQKLILKKGRQILKVDVEKLPNGVYSYMCKFKNGSVRSGKFLKE
jgi:hypothetical protein